MADRVIAEGGGEDDTGHESALQQGNVSNINYEIDRYSIP